MQILIEVSAGELIDKLTVLEIKLENISDPAKLSNVRHEYDLLTPCLKRSVAEVPEIAKLTTELKATNFELWRIEDDIRTLERQGHFGESFVKLARSVYRTNDRRAAIKRRINELLNSTIIEEKSYSKY